MSAAPKLVPKAAPQTRLLKKGELIFSEGESSRAMYLIKSGIIRIFKKKGEGEVEITTIHTGQILGELAFLDGEPRSASGQALTDSELVEISGPVFTNFFNSTPDWFKLLIKTLVSRIRSSSTRIRQLETMSAAFSNDLDGRRSAHYVFLSSHDVMKLSSAILLVGTQQKPHATEQGIELKLPALTYYAYQVMGIPVAKLTSMLDVFTQLGVMKTVGEGNSAQYFLTDIDFVEDFIQHVSQENLADHDHRRDLSLKGFLVLSLIMKHLEKYPKSADGSAKINIAAIKKIETETMKKEPFRLDDLEELAKKRYTTALQIISTDEALTTIQVDAFKIAFRFQRAVMIVQSVNDRKKT